mmetsp:Transcript_89823/g.279525  ORF Transcript_89823/g.279525 Transcript_89823/m.279525 type:complete len:288 (+) Transcript_89823:1352-2215(+)
MPHLRRHLPRMHERRHRVQAVVGVLLQLHARHRWRAHLLDRNTGGQRRAGQLPGGYRRLSAFAHPPRRRPGGCPDGGDRKLLELLRVRVQRGAGGRGALLLLGRQVQQQPRAAGLLPALLHAGGAAGPLRGAPGVAERGRLGQGLHLVSVAAFADQVFCEPQRPRHGLEVLLQAGPGHESVRANRLPGFQQPRVPQRHEPPLQGLPRRRRLQGQRRRGRQQHPPRGQQEGRHRRHGPGLGGAERAPGPVGLPHEGGPEDPGDLGPEPGGRGPLHPERAACGLVAGAS